ncbi:MAG: glycerophosphodiester phosphodiesterase family protein [Myxococcales bacterium]|jgi:glycerophosphoryl diester phosphodiesterase
MDAWRSAQGPLLYAHRGASLEYPENTLPAFEAALSLGADALEIDVHMTLDGHLVVAHDPHGGRTAGVQRAIGGCPLAEVQSWDVGLAHRREHLGAPDAAGPARIPTLSEVLQALPRAALNVDIKRHDPRAAQTAVAVVREHDASDRVLLTSFSSATIDAVRAAGYAGPLGLGQRDAVRAVFAPRALLRHWPLPGSRLQIPPRQGPIPLDRPALVAKMHSLGIAVDYWVINDAPAVGRLLDRGADGIVTDDPRMAAAVFARHPRADGFRSRHPEAVA